MVDKVSSLWLSRSMLGGCECVCPLVCCRPALSLTGWCSLSHKTWGNLLLSSVHAAWSWLLRILSEPLLPPGANGTPRQKSVCFCSAAAVVPFCLAGVELACFVIVTMEKLPSACVPHLPLLLLITLIRMVEDLGQRLLLPPKRPEKLPPPPPPRSPPLFFLLSLFLFLSQSRPHPALV